MAILAIQTDPVRPNPEPAETGWRSELRRAIRDPRELCQLLNLPEEFAVRAVAAAEGFPLLVPRGYVARMRPGDPADPLLRQVLPVEDELVTPPSYLTDPVGDRAAEVVPGLLHKYPGRALLISTGACAVHCRYCFRRHYPYGEAPKSLAAWQPALDQIRADETLHEVLLSGGDPLVLVDDYLARLVERIAAISHVRRLRIHTRLPIVLPERVCPDLLSWLVGGSLTPIVVVHANHPAEIDTAVSASMQRLVSAGVVVLNQAVLLRGVNDTADTMAALCERLVDLGVMPYYLHQLDRVAGASHFDVPESAGREIIAQLTARLPGYAVPRYVREVAGHASKLPIV